MKTEWHIEEFETADELQDRLNYVQRICEVRVFLFIYGETFLGEIDGITVSEGYYSLVWRSYEPESWELSEKDRAKFFEVMRVFNEFNN